MTALETREEADEQAAFRAEARAWLEANAPRRRHDSAEFKRKVTARAEDELASVAAARATGSVASTRPASPASACRASTAGAA